MDIYSFTLENSRIAQVEVNAAQALAYDGTNYSVKMEWTAPWPVPKVGLSARIPQGAQIATPADGASVKAGPQGFSYYGKDLSDVKAGEPASLTFAYSAPAGAASGGTPTGSASSDGGVATAIAIVVMLGALALVGFAVWRKMERAKQVEGPSASPARSSSASASKQSNGKRTAAAQPATAKRAASGGPKKSTILVIGVVVVLVIGVIIAATSGGSATVVGDTVIMTYAAVDECAVANIPLSPPAGSSLADDAEDILETLRPLEGVGKAAINLSTNTITVDYCQSYADEARIRELLAPTGYVQNATAVPTAPAAEATTTP
jgi:hypothetical protein